jgi:hypothetical protein
MVDVPQVWDLVWYRGRGDCSSAAVPCPVGHSRSAGRDAHGIVSMPTELAGPAQLNQYAREHWCVENRLHWTRDVTFREDHSQQRTGAAPRALASFRNLTLNTYRLAGRANIAHARRDLHDRTDTFAVYGI